MACMNFINPYAWFSLSLGSHPYCQSVIVHNCFPTSPWTHMNENQLLYSCGGLASSVQNGFLLLVRLWCFTQPEHPLLVAVKSFVFSFIAICRSCCLIADLLTMCPSCLIFVIHVCSLRNFSGVDHIPCLSPHLACLLLCMASRVTHLLSPVLDQHLIYSK